MIQRLLLAALLFSTASSAQQIYDLLIKGGHVIDPGSQRDGRLDVAIVGNRIARIAAGLPAAQARVLVEADGYYVTPGLIDINAHVDIRAGGLNVYPDYNALRSGVTTVVDAGGSNAENFEAFQAGVIDKAKTRVLAFLNAAPDPSAAARMLARYPKIIVGLAAVGPEAQDPTSVSRVVAAAEPAGTIVMIDSPARPEQLTSLRSGDIYTRMYRQWTQTRAPGAWQSIRAARHRGVLFDVGAGVNGFWFSSVSQAMQLSLLPDTISTGMERESMLLPGTNMVNILSKFLNMGLTLDQIVERTTLRAAQAIRRPELGTLREGSIADLALFNIQQGGFGFVDSGYTRLNAGKRVECVLTVRNGAIVWDSEGLAAVDWIKAGPYSNFK